MKKMIGCVALVLFSLLALSSADRVDPSEAGLYFYYGPTENDRQHYSFENATSLLDHPKFIHNKTHIYLHGFHEFQERRSVRTIIDAYLSSGRHINLVTVDYATLVAGSYISSVTNMLSLAPGFAATLLKLFSRGLNRNDLTLVGHSLGAQLSGATGREIKKQSGNSLTLAKIWGLDPAFPAFPPYETLNKNDADFVGIIHTGAPTFGSPFATAHVDFYPNGGHKVQPGCPDGDFKPLSEEDFCNHQRSWHFWAEDIKYWDEPKFYGYPTNSYLEFLQIGPQALKDHAVIMGNDCDVKARGKYYLLTNAATRFAKGLGN